MTIYQCHCRNWSFNCNQCDNHFQGENVFAHPNGNILIICWHILLCSDNKLDQNSVLVLSCIPFMMLILCVKRSRFLGKAAIALENWLFIDLKYKCITAPEVLFYYQYLTHAAPTRCCSCISYGGLSIPNEKKKTLYTKIKVCFKTLFVKPILAMLDHCKLISNQGLYVYQCCRANIFIYIFLSK